MVFKEQYPMKDKEQDVFAQAAAQMHKAFPPIVQTVTQAKADLQRLYPMDAILAKPLLAFTVGNEDIFAAADKAQALALANTLTKPVPAYLLSDVEQVKDTFLNRPWGKSKDTLQQRLYARSEPGYLAGWQD
jgi:hypothetical protein